VSPDPFAALGLPVRNDLTNEQVRAAWRHIAAATHPDRPDGGDIARYTAAASAYAQLRTQWGRSEAYADQAEATYGAGGAGTMPLPAIGDDEIPARPGAGAARLARACWLLPAPHRPRAAAPAGPARDRRRPHVGGGPAAHRRPARGTGRRHRDHHLVRAHRARRPRAPAKTVRGG
jgi:curved DNA-binding protein CbpA